MNIGGVMYQAYNVIQWGNGRVFVLIWKLQCRRGRSVRAIFAAAVGCKAPQSACTEAHSL